VLYYISIMQNSSNIISSIYKARQTIIALMKKLEYNVSDYEHFSVNEVNTMFQNKQMDMLLEKNKEDPQTGRKNKVYVLFYLAKAIRPANIQEMIDDLFNLEETLTKEDTLLIITKDEMNDTLMANLKHIWETDKIFIVVQNIKRLQFNIHDHILVPPHRVISDEERVIIKTKYNITDDAQFPDISRFDPVAQAICLRPGQICEITRPSKTAIQSIYYRLCV
jgi:DNA-directed RNA polymerase subunit H (RpoH/RPB5)